LERYGKEFTWKVKAGMMGKKAREVNFKIQIIDFEE